MTVGELHDRLEAAIAELDPAVEAGDAALAAAQSLLQERLRQVERANDALTDAVLGSTATLKLVEAMLAARRGEELPL